MEFEERQRKRELKAKLLAEKQQTGANSLPLGERKPTTSNTASTIPQLLGSTNTVATEENLSIHPGRQRDWKRKNSRMLNSKVKSCFD